MKYTKKRFEQELVKAREEMLKEISWCVSIYMNKVADLQAKRAEFLKSESNEDSLKKQGIWSEGK